MQVIISVSFTWLLCDNAALAAYGMSNEVGMITNNESRRF